MSLKRVVILGADADGVRVLRAINEEPQFRYKVIGFLDDDPGKRGIYINNIKVLGPCSMLNSLIAQNKVDEVIVALSETSTSKIQECLAECRKQKLPVKMVPQLCDVLTGKTAVKLVDFRTEDLLSRPTLDTNVENIGGYLSRKKVLITGAGGSIGSELCRQIISMNPASLILLGHGENSIYHIYRQLIADYPWFADNIKVAIASVSNQRRVRQVFEEYHPDIVYHTAAHKHVPIMETNEQEAVSNNVLGTSYVTRACGVYGAEQMILVSTDKAANPCSVMGATKWLCEEVLRAASVHWPATDFITVRFGNVLGSRGSVVPLFREQISHGGPVTVTHPEMTRYFTTIPEAVRLVIQAGAMGSSGRLYLLDMGDPVRIADIAKDMIRLHGLDPKSDIRIEFTGIRPGERLHEQLVADDECISKTPWNGLLLVNRPDYYTPDEITEILNQLELAVEHESPAAIRRILKELVKCSQYSSVSELVDIKYDTDNIESAGVRKVKW